MLPKRDYLTCKILIFNLNLSLKHSTFFFFHVFHVLLNGLCEKYAHISQIKGSTWRHATVKVRLLIMVLQYWYLSGGQAHPGQLQQALLFPGAQIPP